MFACRADCEQMRQLCGRRINLLCWLQAGMAFGAVAATSVAFLVALA